MSAASLAIGGLTERGVAYLQQRASHWLRPAGGRGLLLRIRMLIGGYFEWKRTGMWAWSGTCVFEAYPCFIHLFMILN